MTERVIAQLGRAHGLKGELQCQVRTDVPERRFTAGATFNTQRGLLTIKQVRTIGDRWYLTFDEITDRNAAEEFNGVELVVDDELSDEQDAWYPEELIGLSVLDLEGNQLGTISGLEHAPAQDLLVVDPGGVRVPFVSALVPTVDIGAGHVIMDPPGGLFDEGEDDAH